MSGVMPYLNCFVLSMVPVVELRGAIPMGIAQGLLPAAVYLVCAAGNLVPVPLILLLVRWVFKVMKAWGGVWERIVNFMERKAEKASQMIYKYELLGLFILVALPLPGTGAWTGALVAALLKIRMKVALPIITLGVMSAGAVVLAISCGVAFVV